MTDRPTNTLRGAARPAALRLLAALTIVAGLASAPLVLSDVVAAQGFQWPWETETRPQPRPDPRRPGPYPRNETIDGWSNQTTRPSPQNNATQGWSQRSPVCVQLEQRLVEETRRRSEGRSRLPELREEIRAARQTLARSERELERRDCYESFLFSRSLRRTRQCITLARRAEDAERQLARLENEFQNAQASGGRSYEDDIVRELAANNCGSAYTQEARRRDRGPFSGFWQDEDSDSSYSGNNYGRLPFATYRTLCVRLCDGYYFPVSFSTLPNHFQRDAEVCQSRCAAPAQLYYHQNPGGSIDQMVDAQSNQPYTSLKTAFKYRKEAEFIPKPEPGLAPVERSDLTPTDQTRNAQAEAPKLSPTR